MIKLVKIINNNKLLAFVFISYLLLLITMPTKGILALNNSLYYVKEMLIIMPVILLLTSLIEAWVPKKSIENALGENSGLKGYLFSFLLGSFSAGPIYAAFPVCKMLIKKGASISNIIIILSAWAVIKIPMLANESKFLGFNFMATRWILTIIAILAIAFISSKLIKKEDIPIEKNSEETTDILQIDESFCIGCGFCVKIAPTEFIIENKKANLLNNIVRIQETKEIRIAIDKCPVKAIRYKLNDL